MNDQSSNSGSSGTWKNAVLVVAVVALAAMTWAYWEEKSKNEVAKTKEAAMQEILDKLNARGTKPLTFEFAPAKTGADPELYVQVSAKKKFTLYNRTNESAEVSFPPGAFVGAPGNPFTLPANQHRDLRVNDNAIDGTVYNLSVDQGTGHGGSEMIVGSGP